MNSSALCKFHECQGSVSSVSLDLLVLICFMKKLETRDISRMLPWLIEINRYAEVYLESYQTSMIELFLRK